MRKYLYPFYFFLFIAAMITAMRNDLSIHWKPHQRTIASTEEPQSCAENVQTFFPTEDYEKKFLKALEDRELVSYRTKRYEIKIPYPTLFLRMKKLFANSLRNLNNNKYPALYTYDQESTVATIVGYVKNFHKLNVENPEPDLAKLKDTITGWIKSYTDYQTELNNLINYRVSLQFNLDVLEKLKLTENRTEISLQFFKDGKIITEKVVFYKNDRNFQNYKKYLKDEIEKLDGGWFEWYFEEGLIRQRFVRQALLEDYLTILHRELEYFANNNPEATPELKQHLKNVEALLAKPDLKPSRFALNKMNNRIFRRELADLTTRVKSYKKITQTKEIMDKYLDERDKDRLKIFSNGYSRVFQGTILGTIATGAGGGIFVSLKDMVLFKFNKRYECVKKESDDEFTNCLFEYVRTTHPLDYEMAISSGNSNIFDLKGKSKKFKEDFEYILKLRAARKIMEDRKAQTKEAINNEIKKMYDAIVASNENVNPCAKVDVALFPDCVSEWMARKFPQLRGGDKSTDFEIEFKYDDIEKVPLELRAEYKAELDRIENDRAAYIKNLNELNVETKLLLQIDQ